MTPILIAGPTGSGKSALAVRVARAVGGVVVNADSQQVYAEWRVLTARPSAAEEAAAPHLLYGHVSVAEAYSVGRWLDDVRRVFAAGGGDARPAGASAGVAGGVDPHPAGGRVRAAEEAGGRGALGSRPAGLAGPTPVVVGGTGLYFAALTKGLAAIPDVPAEVRAQGEAALARLGLAGLAANLAARDPETAAAADLANPRRVLRAWEVLEATGTGLAAWRARTPPPVLPLSACRAVALTPPRDRLYAACDARLDEMIAGGALDEVARVMAMDLPPGAPGLKAVGAAELAAHLRGEATLAEARDRAAAETRRYAKRQMTWLRNRMPDWPRVETAEAAMSLLLDAR